MQSLFDDIHAIFVKSGYFSGPPSFALVERRRGVVVFSLFSREKQKQIESGEEGNQDQVASTLILPLCPDRATLGPFQ